MKKLLPSAAFVAGTMVAVIAQTPPPQTPAPTPQQPSEIALVITGEPGAPPHYAVPDFVALTPDAAEAARTATDVLWNDLAFEREFDLIPRDTYRSVRAARTPEQIDFAAWRELGADAVVFGTVQRSGTSYQVQFRLFNVATRQSVYAKEFTGSNVRLLAHTASDEIHRQQRNLRGVARTKLAFSSDRNQERIAGRTTNDSVKEIYIADYDGANPRRVTTSRNLNITPSWSPDTRAIAYTSYRRGFPDIFIALLYQGIQEEPTKGVGQNFLPVWSPDGTKIAFTSNRDGISEIYVMNRDGSGVRRITNNPAIDVTPTWSPSGTQIAFTSDRTGTPQIYVVGLDGLNLRRITTNESWADRPTWSPAPFNEIAYAGRTGGGFDIKVFDLATGQVKQITFGEGSNESPAYSPNGRHIAFTSTRAGRSQIFTIARDGRNPRQVTRDGANFTPAWSN